MEIGHCKGEEGEETFFSAEEEEVEEEDKVKEKMEEEEVEEGFHGFEYRRSLFGLASRKKKLKREVERAEQDLSEERDLTETEKLVKEMMDPHGLSLGIRLTESSTAVQESENLTNNNEENEESRDRAREGGGERKASIYDNKGVLLHSGLDLCDCLEDSCPGCYFPCPKCKSPKCGHECKCSKGADDAGGEVEEQEERKAYEERVKENLRKIKKRPVHERKIVHGRNSVSNKILKIKSFSLFTSNALAFQTPWRQDVEEYSDCVDQTLEILHKKKISESKTLLQEEKDFFLLWNSFLR